MNTIFIAELAKFNSNKQKHVQRKYIAGNGENDWSFFNSHKQMELSFFS